MPTFFTIDGIKIDLYFKDHAPPHFHARFAEYEALIQISNLEILKGELPKVQHKKTLKWAKENQAILMEIWESLQS